VWHRCSRALRFFGFGHWAWILGLYGLLIVFRVPDNFIDPHLYAEESTIYYWYAYTHSFLEALFPYRFNDPYYDFVPIVSTAIAANCVPVEYAPYVTLLAATAVLFLIATLVMLPGSPFDSAGKQTLALLIVLLVPPAFGRLNTNFSGKYLAMATGIVLISSSGTLAAAWVRRGALALGGVTGVLSVFLTPVFWLKAWTQRSREVAIQSAILTVCAIVQLSVVAYSLSFHRSTGGVRFTPFGYDLVAATVFNQSPVHLFFGTPAMKSVGEFLRDWIGSHHLGPHYYALFGLITVVNVGMLLLVIGRRRIRTEDPAFWLFLSYVWIVALSLLASKSGSIMPGKLELITGHQRYFAAPNVFIGLSLLRHASRRLGTWTVHLYRALVVWLLWIGVFLYWGHTPWYFAEGPSWRAEVARWREDSHHPIAVWPAGTWPPLMLPAHRPRYERKIVSPL
jgi:hypothetical protein